MWNKIRTNFSDSPRYFEVNVDEVTLKKVLLHSVATALARSVFPVPGGPTRSTPFQGLRIPWTQKKKENINRWPKVRKKDHQKLPWKNQGQYLATLQPPAAKTWLLAVRQSSSTRCSVSFAALPFQSSRLGIAAKSKTIHIWTIINNSLN